MRKACSLAAVLLTAAATACGGEVRQEEAPETAPPGDAERATLDVALFDDDGFPVVDPVFFTDRDTLDNVDSPAFWHGPDGQHWLLATAKDADVIRVADARSGETIRRVGGSGTELGRFERPNGVAVVDDLMLVVERDNGRVQVMTLPGFEVLGSFGEAELRLPYGIAAYREEPGRYVAYVTDAWEVADDVLPPDSLLDTRVHHYRFTVEDGTLGTTHVKAFGETTGPGILHVVESIAVDVPLQTLLIAEEEEGDSRLLAYTLEGEFTGRDVDEGLFPQEAEGIVLYACGEADGYWIATDQGPERNTFNVFHRGSLVYLGSFRGRGVANTDGIALTQVGYQGFPTGAFAAVHNDGNTALFRWTDIAAALNLRADCTLEAEGSTPTLLVAVVVDQLRGDMLPRFSPAFEGGLARVLEEGRSYTNAVHDHAHTETAPGHATIATGVHPARHGVVANDFWKSDGTRWEEVYAVSDVEWEVLGAPRLAGRSPRNLLRDGLADRLLVARPGSRVVSLSRKDRSAVTMGGRSRDAHVFWIGEGTGRFVTSSWYRGGIPDWVERFNAEVMPRLYADSVWTSDLAHHAAALSRPDTFPGEGDGVHTAFPHHAAREAPSAYWDDYDDWWTDSPAPDTAVLALAERAVQALELGQRGTTDFLSLALSQVDGVGHAYGPLSREQLDNLVRLDRALGAFLDALDREVGPGRWTLVLTSDHGVANLPEAWTEQGLEAVRIGDAMRRREVEVAREAGDEEVVAAALEQLEHVADAMTMSELVHEAPADSLVALFRNSYYDGRRAHERVGRFGADLRLHERWVDKDDATGSTHGSPWYYDRWVPLVMMGPGFEAGTDPTPVRTVDIAPTLARWAGIEMSSDLDGRALQGGT